MSLTQLPTRLSVPALTYPFPARVHPAADEAQRDTTAWMIDRHLVDTDQAVVKYDLIAPGRFAAHVFPDATDEGLRWTANWATWLFTWDDHDCDEAELGRSAAAQARSVAGLIRVVDNPDYQPPEQDRFAAALADLRDRFTRLGSPMQWARFAGAFRAYMLGVTWEAAHREAARCAPLHDYITMRAHSGAMWTVLAVADAVCGFELADELFFDPRVVDAGTHAVRVVCYSNDVYSFPREAATQAPGGMSNLVAVLMEQGLDAQAAIDRTVAMHDAELDAYRAVLAELSQVYPEGAPARRYLDALSAWLAGNGAWALSTPRYNISAHFLVAAR